MTTPTPSEAGTSWTPLCAVDRLTPERAVAALTPAQHPSSSFMIGAPRHEPAHRRRSIGE